MAVAVAVVVVVAVAVAVVAVAVEVEVAVVTPAREPPGASLAVSCGALAAAPPGFPRWCQGLEPQGAEPRGTAGATGP